MAASSPPCASRNRSSRPFCGSSSVIQHNQLPQHYNPQPKGLLITLLLFAMATMAFVYQIQREGGLKTKMERHLVEPHKPINAAAMKLDSSFRLGVFGSHTGGTTWSSYAKHLASSPGQQVSIYDIMSFQHYGLCLDSILKEGQVFDIILLEYDLNKNNHHRYDQNNNNNKEGFQLLARKLRARYPQAILILITDWAAPWNFRRRDGMATPHMSQSFQEWSQGSVPHGMGIAQALEQDVSGDWYHVHHYPQDDILPTLAHELQARLYSLPLAGLTGRDSLMAYLSHYSLESKTRSMEGTVALSDALYFEVQSAMLERNFGTPLELVAKSELYHQQHNNDKTRRRDEHDFCHYWYWNGNETVAVYSDYMSRDWKMKQDSKDYSFGLELTPASIVQEGNITAWMVLTNPLFVAADLYFSYTAYVSTKQQSNPPSIMVNVLSVPDGILMQRHPLETLLEHHGNAAGSHIRTLMGGENLPPQVPMNFTFTTAAGNEEFPFRLVGYLYSHKETPLEWDFGSVHSSSIQ